MFEHLIKQMSERGGVTEHLKAADQMEWVHRINNIRNQATEIVNSEIVLPTSVSKAFRGRFILCECYFLLNIINPIWFYKWHVQ